MIKVSTDKLRDGDMIKISGAVIRIEGKPTITIGPRGTVFMWPNMKIIEGQFEPFPQARRWTIIGDTLTFWPVNR